MGLFGNKKQEQLDTSQDQQLKQLWMWITQLNKNQEVLIKNNSYFIQKLKENDQKNIEQDAKMQEFAKLFQGLAQASQPQTQEG